MTCRKYEAWIALWAGGDLAPDEAAVLEAHLENCEPCRVIAQEMTECCATLAELRTAPLMSVRAAVMERIAQPSRKWWFWWWIPATAALAGFAIWYSGLDTRIPSAPPPPTVRAAAPPEALHLTPRPKLRPVSRRKPQPAGEESFTVKLLTDDPDVVIYWLFDKKGD